MAIGIGITTRARPDMLALCLRHMREFRPRDAEIVVVEDLSDTPHFFPPHGVDLYYRSPTRLGIARAKNTCLKLLAHCDHVFLFDDDAWPRSAFWADAWIAEAEAAGLHHSQWARPVDAIQPTHRNTFIEWSNCLGVCLHFSRHALNTLGGYAVGPAPYGYEHAAISRRAHLAGLSPAPYVSPLCAQTLIYSVDICWGHFNEQPPLGTLDKPPYASLSQAEALRYNENDHLLIDSKIYYPLE